MSGTNGNGIGLSVQARPCPDDFDIVFIEKGRAECEAHYRARRTTIIRWLEERGKDRLIAKRTAFVRSKRHNGASTQTPRKCAAKPGCRRKVDPRLAEMAGRFLQRSINGGWVVYRREDGNFVVGTMAIAPAELVDMAMRKGFDRRRAQQQIKVFAEAV